MVYRLYFTSDPFLARLLKGVEVGSYHLREKLSRQWWQSRDTREPCLGAGSLRRTKRLINWCNSFMD